MKIATPSTTGRPPAILRYVGAGARVGVMALVGHRAVRRTRPRADSSRIITGSQRCHSWTGVGRAPPPSPSPVQLATEKIGLLIDFRGPRTSCIRRFPNRQGSGAATLAERRRSPFQMSYFRHPGLSVSSVVRTLATLHRSGRRLGRRSPRPSEPGEARERFLDGRIIAAAIGDLRDRRSSPWRTRPSSQIARPRHLPRSRGLLRRRQAFSS